VPRLTSARVPTAGRVNRGVLDGDTGAAVEVIAVDTADDDHDAARTSDGAGRSASPHLHHEGRAEYRQTDP
jgi:hypothetical protein